jgi:hypothetical protein
MLPRHTHTLHSQHAGGCFAMQSAALLLMLAAKATADVQKLINEYINSVQRAVNKINEPYIYHIAYAWVCCGQVQYPLWPIEALVFFLINFIEKIKLSKFPINIVFAVKFKFIGKNVQKSRNYSS